MRRQRKQNNVPAPVKSIRPSRVARLSSSSDDSDQGQGNEAYTLDTAASLSALNIDDEDEPMPSTSRGGPRSSQSQGLVTMGNGSGLGGRKEIRKQYNTLIEKCQEFEEKDGFDKTMEELMSKNIGKGQKLFDEISGGPGDMFLAFMHTRICSSMLKSKTANIGSNTSAFKVDLFLSSLLEKCVTAGGEYDPRQAVKCISSSATDCCRTLNPMTVIVGAIEQKAQDPAASKEKEKKQRAPIRKRQFDDTAASQATHRELMTKMNSQPQSSQKGGHESFSKEILAVLKTRCRSAPEKSMNIFEFILDKSSFASTIESLFYVAFLVRDGEVSFFRQDNQPNHDYTISIKPETPPAIESETVRDKVRKKKKKKKSKTRASERSQFILSFSVQQWRELCALSTGENIISDHKQRMNNAADDEEIERGHIEEMDEDDE